ncbi:type II toxin-antitoxin system prevent-host-death family antitoxin [Streptomyces sp. NPDC085614]|uniref:type II toxin-antitoxin system prevent-host-death family antitoxin n=1 Tax=Streptomyces sp. NPDC085614 TaxID=3365733 RepID=UPI0037D35447
MLDIDLRKQMGEILDRALVTGEPATISRRGTTLAYLVPAEWFEQYMAQQT